MTAATAILLILPSEFIWAPNIKQTQTQVWENSHDSILIDLWTVALFAAVVNVLKYCGLAHT